MSEAQEPVIGREVKIVNATHPHTGEVGVIGEYIQGTGQYVIDVAKVCQHGQFAVGALPSDLQFTAQLIKNEPPKQLEAQQGPEFEKLKKVSNIGENNQDNSENSNEFKGRGGRRPGSGRKKGGYNQSTLDRMAIKRQIEDRIHLNADNLLNAAMNKALGETYLMKKVTERDSKGKVLRTYHEIVTSPQEIIDYLDGELEGNTPLDEELDDVYHYITTKPADILAFKDLYDRAFGKPAQTINTDLTSKGERIVVADSQAEQLLRLRAKRG